MDLRAFYFQNIQQNEYHHSFYSLIKNVNTTHNIFNGYEETKNYTFEVFDAEEAITKFKELCNPSTNIESNENKCWFYLITYYLYKMGYELKEFPRVLARPPKDPIDFTYGEIRTKLIALGEDHDGIVRYATRRKFISTLTFELKSPNIEIEDAINQKFIEISNRQAPFSSMSTDEKLAEIANLIENLLKKDNNFIILDYSRICFEYISNDIVISYRKKIQCFRHAHDKAIAERNSYTEEQKKFFIDYGLTIINAIHSLTLKN
ncbi:MAG: hypothetical protein ACLRT4_02650 [Thomasclavelia sp.]